MRYEHNLSFEHKTSVDMGLLVPVGLQEVLPGDTFMQSSRVLARVAPLVAPTMHRVELRLHHWYVPNRIIWDKFDTFITGEDDLEVVPTVAHSEIERYMGAATTANMLSALPRRAYNLIWNEMYRDQDLQTPFDLDDETLKRICWQKDYFTTARPSPQQGDPETISLGGQAPITGLGVKSTASWGGNSIRVTGGITESPARSTGIAGDPNLLAAEDPNNTGYPAIYADLSTASGINIDDLRRSVALQRFSEARARYGERYVDYLRYLGVNPSDGRLDRPEFLGGGSQTINFSEVLATAEGAATNVGDLYGHGIAGLGTRRYRKFFEEHGYVVSLLSARPKTVYQDAVPKTFLRSDNMDFWQKELEVMPWQELRAKEVHKDGDDTVFGYVPRYDEYRHQMSYVSGTLQGGTEEHWHMARSFASPPTLNASFVECTPTDRIYGDTSMPELICNIIHNVRAKRFVRSNAGIGTMGL